MPITFIPFTAAPSKTEQVTVITGGTSNLSRHPLYGLYDYSQAGFIYLASELLAAGIQAGSKIDALEFQFNGWTTGYTANNQKIKMSVTRFAKFPDPADPSYRDIEVELLTTVKNNFSLIIPSKEDWIKFDFDTPITWNGTDNILISWENRDGSWESGYGYLEGKYEGHRSHNWFSDDVYPSKSSSWDNYLPNLRLWCDKFEKPKEEEEPPRR